MTFGSHTESVIVFSGITILLYAITRKLHLRIPQWWTSPLLLAPILLAIAALLFHVSYSSYIGSTHWMVLVLGPVTVAFAVPIYQQRKIIARSWQILAVGLLAGSLSAILSSWFFANILGLNDTLRLSLLPRSMSTPFAMTVSGAIGGVPDLTAVFVAITGVCGVGIGEAIIQWLPIRSALARGALLGLGAHGAGVARAKQLGQEEASVAGLIMVFAGLTNVLLAPVTSSVVRHLLQH